MKPRSMLIAGATGGVGRELVRLALSNDWQVVGVGRDAGRIATLQGELNAGARLRVVACNLADVANVAALGTELGEDYCPDALVHLAAAPLEIQPIQKLGWDAYERQINGTVRPAILLTELYLKKMAARGSGRIVAALSAAVLGVPPRGFAAYTTAKYALWGYMRSLASEYAGRGLVVGCVSPSAMETGLLRELPGLMIESLRAGAPGGRWMEPAAVARTIYWLASEAGPEVTGCNIPVTCGVGF